MYTKVIISSCVGLVVVCLLLPSQLYLQQVGEQSVVTCYTLTVKPAASTPLSLPSLFLFVASETSDSWCTHWLLRRSSLISGMEVAMAVASVWRDARTRHWSVHVQEFHPPLMARYHSSATSSHASQ